MDKALKIQERFYLERQNLLESIDRYITAGGPPLVLTGTAGSGKSALIQKLVHDRSKDESSSPMLVLSQKNRHTGMSKIIHELKNRFDIPLDIPSKLKSLDTEFGRWLYIAGNKSSITLLIDNVDQISGREINWLPTRVPENVRIIITSSPGNITEILKARGWQMFEIPPLDDFERDRLIDGIQSSYEKILPVEIPEKIKSTDKTRDPLFLTILLESLLTDDGIIPDFEGLINCDTVPSLVGKILVRPSGPLKSLNGAQIRDIFSCIAVSLDGIALSAISDLLKIDPGIIGEIINSPLLRETESGNIVFAHDEVGVAVKYLWFNIEQTLVDIHRRLADYFSSIEPGPENIFRVIHHLTGLKDWDRLRDYLGNLSIFETAWTADPVLFQTLWENVRTASGPTPARVYRSVINNPSESLTDETLEHLADFLTNESYISEAAKILEFASERYRRSGFDRDLVRTLLNHAEILERRNDLDNALRLFREAESLCRENSWPDDLVKTLDGLSGVFGRLGETAENLKVLLEREKLLEKGVDKFSLAQSYGDIAGIYAGMGKNAEAVEFYNRQEKICRELNDPAGLVRCFNNFGAHLMKLGQLDDAFNIFTEQEELCRGLGYRNSLQTTLGNIGIIRQKWGDLDDALKLFEEQEKISREIDSPRNIQNALKSQALLHNTRGAWEIALRLLQKQEKILRDLGDKKSLAKWLGVQAQIMRENGRVRGSLRLLRECEDIAREGGDLKTLQMTLSATANVYMRLDEADTALSILKDEEKIAIKIHDIDALQTCLGTQAVIHRDKFDFDIALKLHAREEELARKSGNFNALQRSLGNQALILRESGKLQAALKKHEEELRINRSLESENALQRTLGNMASVLLDLKRYDDALVKVDEQEEICKRLKLWDNLSIANGKRAWVYSKTGRIDEAKELIEDVYQHAIDNRMQSVIAWMKPIYLMIKNMAKT